MWLKDSRYEEIVTNAWVEGSVFAINFPISRYLEFCQNRLEVWKKNEFGHVKRRIAEL